MQSKMLITCLRTTQATMRMPLVTSSLAATRGQSLSNVNFKLIAAGRPGEGWSWWPLSR